MTLTETIQGLLAVTKNKAEYQVENGVYCAF